MKRRPGRSAGRRSGIDPKRQPASVGDREDAPLTRDAFGLVEAAVDEREVGTADEVAHRARDEHFPTLGERGDARPGVHHDSGEVVASHLTFTGVQSRPDLEAEALHIPGDLARAADRAGGTVEGSEETIPDRLDLTSVEACERSAHCDVVLIEQLSPLTIPDARSTPRRIHDVAEHHGLEGAVDVGFGPLAGDELLDLLHDGSARRPGPPPMVLTPQLDISRARDVVRVVPPMGDRHDPITVAVNDQGRDRHGREYRANVDLAVHLDQSPNRSRASGHALETADDLAGPLVASKAGSEQQLPRQAAAPTFVEVAGPCFYVVLRRALEVRCR